MQPLQLRDSGQFCLCFPGTTEMQQAAQFCLSNFHGKEARLATRDTRRGATAHRIHKASYLSSKPWVERDTLDISTAVSTARTFVCLSGTDSSPCQELGAQQVTGSVSPDGREASAEREVREMRCSKGDDCSWWKQNNSAGAGENQALTDFG